MEFKLTEQEWKVAEEFMEKHRAKNTGAIGGQFSISFTMTSIGDIATIIDDRTGEEKTLTDFSIF